MRDRTIRTVSGYGAGLRDKLEALGVTQAWLAKAASLSRQTVSRAVNRDELSALTRAKVEDALRDAGSAHRRSAPDHTSEAGSGTGRGLAILGDTLCNATDLVQWSDRRDARGMLPLLVRRLIRVTANGCSKLHVRTHEGVQLSGWDGIVHCERDSTFVPAGMSGWEMSVARRPGSKAEHDWATRTADGDPLQPEDASIVLVTSRRWSGKEEWARRKEEEGPWRQVIALDADDLAAWLEDARRRAHAVVHPARKEAPRSSGPRVLVGRVVRRDPSSPDTGVRSGWSRKGARRDPAPAAEGNGKRLGHSGRFPGRRRSRACTAPPAPSGKNRRRVWLREPW